ncbi:MAG: RseA family anti-sigma factor [Acidovorax sp.]
MNEDLTQGELVSALADGELQGDAFAQAVGVAAGAGRPTWALYHLVGDVLRSPELAHHGRSNLLAAVRAGMAEAEAPRPQAQPLVAQVAPPEARSEERAANLSVFRWKMVAGFASLAAVSAIGWNAVMGLRADNGAQVAAAVPSQAAPGVVATAVEGQNGPQVMLRDARLDELLAAHKQLGGTSALQMPAGFLRNATFEAPAR